MKKRRRANRYRVEASRKVPQKPKEARRVPPMTEEQKGSIVFIILRDYAATFRKAYPTIRIEAYPKNESRAVFHATLDKQHRFWLELSQFNDYSVIAFSKWRIGGDEHTQIPFSALRGSTGMDLVDLSQEHRCQVSILEPDSLDKLEKWIGLRISTLLKHVNSLDNNGSAEA
jgi:hypothetical protein